jgi:hypothetical protein
MKKLLFYSAIATIVLAACKKEISPSGETSSSNLSLNPSGFDNNRIEYFWDQIQPFQKSANDGITFYHVANVSSPTVNGALCSATGMDIVGNYCYVTYHVAGAAYGGALEVFDISSPANPVLVSQMILNDTDLNECTVKNGKLYAVGGRNIYTSGFTANNTKGGVLLEVSLNNNLLTNNVRWVALPSYSGNSVNAVGSYLFVISGSTGGGVFTLNASDLAIVQSDYYDNAKFAYVKSNQLGNPMLVLQGNPSATVYKYAANVNNIAGRTQTEILSQSVPANGKAVLKIDNNDVYICTGNNGLKGYNINNLGGTPILDFNSPGNGNANGVDTDGQFIYVANGTEGNIIINKDDKTIHTIFPFSGSANYVRANGNYVFIANGKGGLKVLRRVNPVISSGPLCGNRPILTPAAYPWDFNINSGQSFAYRGSNVFNQSFNNNSIFYYCGSMVVRNNMHLNSGSFTEVEGSLSVNNQLHINSNSTLKISGSVTIIGNLYLKGNLQFYGSGSSITVLGSVITSPGYSVTGNYTSNVPL